MRAVILWIAEGFGSGRIPVAPGTFGTVVGIGWFFILLASGNPVFFLAGTALGLALSVWICGAAERLTGRKDPSSVVLDEITAVPVCFVSWLWIEANRTGQWPAVGDIFGGHGLGVLGVFVAFRFFDIVKPWPVGPSQNLPGGWGVTVDDLLAAIYVNVVVLGWLLIAGA
jgi:phosphatidylglycerophosphatase A